jgi:hypothetical protein
VSWLTTSVLLLIFFSHQRSRVEISGLFKQYLAFAAAPVGQLIYFRYLLAPGAGEAVLGSSH